MRPPINRSRPVHPDDDVDERRELHAAEIAMDKDLDDPKGNSMVKTQLYDVGETVDQGRLGAAIRTLRLASSSVRRLIGRMGLAEERTELAHDRIAVVEWAVVLLLGLTGMALWGAGLGLVSAIIVRLWLWWAA